LERWEVFLRALSERLSVASEKIPTVRCWKHSALTAEIKAVIRANQSELRTTFPPACNVIEHLKRMGWVQPIQAQPSEGRDHIEFLLVDAGSREGQSVSPLELLQAWLPTGVICYFSALTHHELTTQTAAYHHIARLTHPRPRKEPVWATEPKPTGEAVERSPLGTDIFRLAEVACYVTRRDASLVPGIQMRVVSPRTWLRITTLEQTLLDTLLQPLRCGGEAVILEAWQNGVNAMDGDRMSEYLGKIQRDDLDRRVGAVLDLLGTDVATSSLGHRLGALKERLATATTEIPNIPLLWGFQFPDRSEAWKVRIP
jgi:predicted transcriptional regulator of viral defense system